MQPMLGVSFLNTHTKNSTQNDDNSLPFDSSSNEIAPLKQVDTGFKQVFNKQFTPANSDEKIESNVQIDAQDSNEVGESFPIELTQIGNKLSEFESLDDLKVELENNGLSPIFFDIGLNEQNEIEIQATPEDELKSSSMSSYTSILVMQVSVEQLENMDFDSIDLKDFDIEGIDLDSLLTDSESMGNSIVHFATKALNLDTTQILDQAQAEDDQALTSPTAIMQWLKANATTEDIPSLDEKYSSQLSSLFGQLSQSSDSLTEFDPELKEVIQSQIKELLAQNDALETDNKNVTFIVINPMENKSAEFQEQLIPQHVSDQLFLQSQRSANPSLNSPEAIQNTGAILDEAEFSTEFLKTKNVIKDDVKSNVSLQSELQELDSQEESSEYEELNFEDTELELNEPSKTRRAMQADSIVQSEKTISAKPGQIELPAISLSDAKLTNASIKAVPLQNVDVMQSILPEKQAVKLTEEVGARVMMLHNQKMTSAFIRLDPPELGALEIQIETKGDEAKVTIVTSQVNIKEALDSQANKLREMLQEQGFTQVDVDVKEQNQSQKDGSENENSSNDNGEIDSGELDEVTAQEKSVHLVDHFI